MSWYETCYSRILIDNHITDRKPEYMRRFDPAEYVRMIALSGVESAMVYASDHNGNCYYPTRVGHCHAGAAGRDLFGETVAGLEHAGIIPVAYHTLIYQNEVAQTHPAWQVCDANGKHHSGRYWWCCPNHPEYRAFCKEQISEILAYPVRGIFLDMTFWPAVCCCDACRAKYRAEAKSEIPETIDWKNPDWVRFQRWRERSLAEYALEMSEHVRSVNPELSVTHQFSPVLHGWFLGQSDGIAAASDYASGDFYGGKLQQRFGVKAFAAFTRNRPYEFMTSRCVSLHDHTSTKSDDELFLHAATTLANGGAYFFIDAINPDGTLSEPFYSRLGRITARLEPYRKKIAEHRPVPRAEVGLYFSMASCVDESRNGQRLDAVADRANNMEIRRNAVLDEVLGTSELLNFLHIPCRVLTGRPGELDGLSAVIVNHAAYLTPEECEALRNFAAAGGVLIATGKSSLYTADGDSAGNFQLADVFGVDYSGSDAEPVSYLAAEGELLSVNGVRYPLVTLRTGAERLGGVVLPDFPVNDPEEYASIHSNPPGAETAFAGLVENRYGKGRCFYLYSGLFAMRNHSQRSFSAALLGRILPRFVTEARNLPPCVELTLLESEDGKTLLLALVNVQEELPNLPLFDLAFTVKLPEGFAPRSVNRVSTEGKWSYAVREGELSLTIDRPDDFELFELIPE